MTQSGKLGALIELAFERGWEFDNLDKWHVETRRKTNTVMNNWYQFVFTHPNASPQIIDAERILFDHDFARALFGECDNWIDGEDFDQVIPMNGFERHLQQAVISDDPIDYMHKVVFGNDI